MALLVLAATLTGIKMALGVSYAELISSVMVRSSPAPPLGSNVKVVLVAVDDENPMLSPRGQHWSRRPK